VKTYYELLDVAPDASADEIKRAFRREIAKYHPDKVQHLGAEFQEIAAHKAAALTQAYKVLSDPDGRAEYDAQLAAGGPVEHAPAAAPPAEAPPRQAPARPSAAPPPQPRGPEFDTERRGVDELMRRATLGRFESALKHEFGSFEQVSLPGFEVVVLPAQKFWSLRPPPRVLGKFVPLVDGQAVADAWSQAARMKKDGPRDLCVFLMGPALASATELAVAIGEQRKKPMPGGGKVVLIPVCSKDWSAHVPTDAPDVCKSLLSRLKAS
jgi:hypothetical protein